MRPIYYDTETTGIKSATDRIVEIAGFCSSTGEEFCAFVQPGIPIPAEASAVHNITDEMVADAPTWKEVGQQFIDFCGPDAILIAHNGDAFDIRFLRAESERHGIELPEWRMIDTLKWARKYRPDLPRHSLQFLREMYGIPANNAHRALDDVIVLRDLFELMIDDLSIETVHDLLHSQQQINRMPFGKHRGKSLEEVPASYWKWLDKEGALDKPENVALRNAVEELGLLTATS